MDSARIAALLSPYLGGRSLADAQLAQLAAYLDLLLRWNARINLTAIRDPEQIVSRHFGESLFAALHLYPKSATRDSRLIDLGSGAGFPGIPIKIGAPALRATLLESNQRKATFLREVVRALQLTGVEVLATRAENYSREAINTFASVGPGALTGAGRDITEDDVARAPSPATDVTVTLRAVERFQQILPTAIRLLEKFPAASKRLALLIGAGQVGHARLLAKSLTWSEPLLLPESSQRVLLIGNCNDLLTP